MASATKRCDLRTSLGINFHLWNEGDLRRYFVWFSHCMALKIWEKRWHGARKHFSFSVLDKEWVWPCVVNNQENILVSRSVPTCVQFTRGVGKLSVQGQIIHISGFSGHLICHTFQILLLFLSGCTMWQDHGLPTRDWTCAPCIGSTEAKFSGPPGKSLNSNLVVGKQSQMIQIWLPVTLMTPGLILLLLLLSHFSRVQLCATPDMAAHQAPPSLGFSRQEV